MTENTLMDRLRAAERDECCNDKLCDEAADALDLGEQAVVDLIEQNAELIKRAERLVKVLHELLDERRELQLELEVYK